MITKNYNSTCAADSPVNALFGLLYQGKLGTATGRSDLIASSPLNEAVRCWPRPTGQLLSKQGTNLGAEFSGFVGAGNDSAADQTGFTPPAPQVADTTQVVRWLSEFPSPPRSERERSGPSGAASGASDGTKDFDALCSAAASTRHVEPPWAVAGIGDPVTGRATTNADDFSGEYHPDHVTALYIESRGGPDAICPTYSCLVPIVTGSSPSGHISCAADWTHEFSAQLRPPVSTTSGSRTSSIPRQLNAGLQGIAEAERQLLETLFGETRIDYGDDEEPSPSSYCQVQWDWNRIFGTLRDQDLKNDTASIEWEQSLVDTSRRRLALLCRHFCTT